jgi:hypothetical protein
MRTALIGFCLAFGCWLAAGAQASIAPSDELFGSARLSTATIKSSLYVITSSLSDQRSDTTLVKLRVLQDAVDDWATSYPKDPAAKSTYEEVCRDLKSLGTIRGADAAWRNCQETFTARFP